jgi:uncharacterized membrane protein
MPRRPLCVLVTISILLIALSSAHAASYTVTLFNGPGAQETLANGINDKGEIVGWYLGPYGQQGYLYDDGIFTPLDVPGGQANITYPIAINNAGWIVGWSVNSLGNSYSFLYDGSVLIPLNLPASLDPEPHSSAVALGINDRAQVVGWYIDTNIRARGFLYKKGVFTSLDVPGATETYLRGINNRGQMVGYYIDSSNYRSHGFLYDKGKFTTLDVPGALITAGTGINDKGQIVGGFDGGHGFLYDAGKFTILDIPGALRTDPFGINNQGQIIGWYTERFTDPEDPYYTCGFLATPSPDSNQQNIGLCPGHTVGPNLATNSFAPMEYLLRTYVNPFSQ